MELADILRALGGLADEVREGVAPWTRDRIRELLDHAASRLDGEDVISDVDRIKAALEKAKGLT